MYKKVNANVCGLHFCVYTVAIWVLLLMLLLRVCVCMRKKYL